MRHTRQDIANLRDSQVNVFASLAVYVAVWAILQVLLRLFDVDIPLVQIFDRYGSFSAPGILVALLLLISAFVPHWILLRRANLSWREGSQLIRDFNEGLPEGAHEERVREAECPSPEAFGLQPTDIVPSEDSAYWEQRWAEVIQPLSDEERKAQD